MAADDLDPDLDPRLARRLAALHPDVADDGFTASLMARLPERARATPAPVTAPRPVWPLALAAALALGLLALLLGSGGDTTPGTDLFAGIGAASSTARDLGGLFDRLPALFETHLYTLVAMALCAATLLAPQLLED